MYFKVVGWLVVVEKKKKKMTTTSIPESSYDKEICSEKEDG